MPFGLGSARRAGLQGTKRQQSFVNKFLMRGIIVALTHHPAFGRALERQRDGTRHAPSVHNFQSLRRVNLTGKIRQQNFPSDTALTGRSAKTAMTPSRKNSGKTDKGLSSPNIH